MKRTPLLALTLAAACLAGGFALGRASAPRGLLASLPGNGPALASFRGGTVSRADVLALFEKQPAALRERLRTLAARREVVEELVRIEILAREGERRGLDRDPEFLRRYKDELGRAFEEKEFETPQRKAGPTDAELRAFYDEHKAALARPERARVAVVQYAAVETDAAARSAKRAKAQAALASLRASKDPRAFARLASTESDDVRSRLANGELPFLTKGEVADRLGAEVADAGFAIARTGDVASAVVESPKGFHVVKLLGREDGYQPSFEEVREQIRDRLTADRRRDAHDAFLEQLWKRADVKLDDKAIEALRVD